MNRGKQIAETQGKGGTGWQGFTMSIVCRYTNIAGRYVDIACGYSRTDGISAIIESLIL
ncbi:hypothetical protein [Prevotella dentasini]|uniref:hypothetical protein n=1 Tax=Prevotella dentasini TaxID=589537 RepID=UPI000A8AF49A|nr:hypothetical protein [Prevotella dentasini]